MTDFVHSLQSKIVSAVEEIETKKFLRDSWTRDEGGTGTSCVLQDGSVFEKAGVNVSVIHGPVSPALLQHMRARRKHLDAVDADKLRMFAAGISLVMHPHNPHAPTVHLTTATLN